MKRTNRATAVAFALLAACSSSYTVPSSTGAITVLPAAASLPTGATQQFLAHVENAADQTVTWSVDETGAGAVDATGLYTAPSAEGSYHVRATSRANSQVSAAAVVTVGGPVPPPVIGSFGANPSAISTGQTSTLSWSVSGATSISIDNGVGTVTGTTRLVSPTANTTYTLTATNAAGATAAQATVTVTPPGTFISPSPLNGDVVATMDSHTITPISPFIYGLNFAELGGANVAGTALGAGNSNMWTSVMPKYTINRFGGNRVTGFNWENGASNCGSDCGFSNQAGSFSNDATLIDNVGAGSGVGASLNKRVDLTSAAGAAMLLSMPILGYVAKDVSGQQPIPLWGSSTTPGTPAGAHWLAVQPANPAGATATPSTTDAFVYSDDYVKWVDTTFPGALAAGTIQFELDNEADIWKGTHAEIMGTSTASYTSATTNAQQVSLPFPFYPQRAAAHATAIKAVSPGAIVWAGAFAGWDGLTQFNFDSHPNGPPCADGSEPSASGCTGAGKTPQYTWYFDYLLDQFVGASTTAGHRLVDVFDQHWYVQNTTNLSVTNDDATQDSATILAREQSPRSLWDTKYIEGSWLNGSVPLAFQANCSGGRCPIALLKHMQDSIAARDPAMKIAIGEYWYGRGGDISSAIANVDLLGILARMGVYAATMWPNASNVWAYNTPNGCNGDATCTTNHAYQCAMKAIDVYRRYDGASAKAGDSYIPTTPSDATFTSPGTQNERFTAYASMDAGNPNRVVIVATNKTLGTALNAGFRITHPVALHTVEAWTLTGTNGGGGGCTGPTRGTDITVSLTNAFNATLPPQSVVVLVMKP